jgi:hypothetical protein
MSGKAARPAKRDLLELSFLYHEHPLLVEVQEREFEIAQLNRRLAAADVKKAKLENQLAAFTSSPRRVAAA